MASSIFMGTPTYKFKIHHYHTCLSLVVRLATYYNAADKTYETT
jgi:hypothetical protein